MSPDPIVTWLLAPGSGSARPEDLVANLCARLEAEGLPVARASVSLPTLHPELYVCNITWTQGAGCVVAERGVAVLVTPFYLGSPPALIHAGADEIRCRLDGDAPDLRYGVGRDLREAGYTDYVALVVPFRDGRRTFISWATRRPGGFRDGELARLRSLIPVLSLRLELASADHAMRSLLDVYLGHNAARRVLAGAFRRGGGETIRAAIWSCDLRGFTAMADRLPAAEVVATLDRYFETVCAPIAEGGGEVLKFIGDAVLAIFPAGDDEVAACRRALAAAKGAIVGIRRWNEEREEAIGVGVALHVGDVTYGNIGAQRRLDFTVIGAAVNEVCRVEGLCKELGRSLLVTDAFAARVACRDLVALGTRALRGVAEPRAIFGIEGY
jgi:adenylate cyclase